MRVRVVVSGVAACALALAFATSVLMIAPASAQTLECGAGGNGARGPNGGWGVSAANGGSGTMPNCGQNTNGDAAPTMNCHAGGDAGEGPVKPPKTLGPTDPNQGSGVVAGNIGGAARFRTDRNGLHELEVPPTPRQSARGGSGATHHPQDEFDGKGGDGGTGTMPQCQQNTNGDFLGASDWAADGVDSGAADGEVLGTFATRWASDAVAGTATGATHALAHTGGLTQLQLGVAGLAIALGGMLVLASLTDLPQRRAWLHSAGWHLVPRRQ
jgi:hypothetical protein